MVDDGQMMDGWVDGWVDGWMEDAGGWRDGWVAVFRLQAGESCKFWKEVGNQSLLLSSFLELTWGIPPFVPT